MLTVYLDQNKWIDLARADHGHPKGKRFEEVLLLAESGVRLGLARFPLSRVHYFETWNRRAGASRQRLARTMVRISDFWTIADGRRLLDMELDRALQRRFGRPHTIRTVNVFGHFAAHAFGADVLDWQPPASLGLTGPQVELLKRTMELSLLSGPAADLPVAGLDTESYKHYSGDYRAAEERVRAMFQELRLSKAARATYLAAGSLVDILMPLNAALARAGISTGEFQSLGEDGLTAFLKDLPTRRVDYDLRRRLHDLPQQKWTRTDLDDMAALSVSVPYCDVVVTERKWKGLITSGHIADGFVVRVITDLVDLAPILTGSPKARST